MAATSENELWVLCPVCHKANPEGTRYCEHCWGAVIHPDISITSEEVDEAARRREAYLKRKKGIKTVALGISFLAVLFAVYFSVYYTTDIIFKPPQGVNSNSLPGDWAMFRHDLGHSGSTESSAILPKGTQKWVFATGAAIHSSPAVADGIVYIGSQDSKLYAVDADTGAKRWEYETDSWVESSPSVANGTVYFGSNDGRLYALNAQSGEKTWDFETDFPVTSAPAIAGGTVFFGSDDYYLYAVDVTTGTKLWDFNIESPAFSSPAVSNGIVYIGSANGYSYALNTLNGQHRLRFRAHYSIYTAPAVSDGTVYVVTTNGLLYAFDGNARTIYGEHEVRPYWAQLWIMGVPLVPRPPIQTGFLLLLRLGGPATSSPVIVDNNLYIGMENKLVSFDLQSREKRWEFVTGGTIRSSPAVVGSTIFVGSEDGRLYAVDAASGEKLWDFLTADKITSSPAVANGIVYIGSHDGNLYAIE